MRQLKYAMLLCCVGIAAFSNQANASIIVHTSDFIADGSRDHFVGFETAPFSIGNSWTEDGVTVSEVFGQNDIISSCCTTLEGSKKWYPNGGDYGYTRIVLNTGGDMTAIGFLKYSGNAGHTQLRFALFNDGNLVAEQNISTDPQAVEYIGFSGMAFDEVWLRDGQPTITGFGQGGLSTANHNALNLDAIEIVTQAVPEPTTLAVLGLGLAGLGAAARRRKTH